MTNPVIIFGYIGVVLCVPILILSLTGSEVYLQILMDFFIFCFGGSVGGFLMRNYMIKHANKRFEEWKQKNNYSDNEKIFPDENW